jgi:hypothetical protein
MTSDQLEVVSDFSAGAYLFLFHAPEDIPRSKIEVPFVDRSKKKSTTTRCRALGRQPIRPSSPYRNYLRSHQRVIGREGTQAL